MPCHNPTSEGFKALREEPALFLAETGWRWLFGSVALAFTFWALIVFLDLIEVSRSNLFLLQTMNPDAMAYALERMFAGKGPLMLKLLFTAGPSLSLLWIATSTVGRIATTRVMLERSAQIHGTGFQPTIRYGAVIGIQVFRAFLVWMGAVAYVACAFVAAATAGSGREFRTGVFVLLFLLLFGASVVILSLLHWWAGLAPIFALRDGLGAIASLGAARTLVRRGAGQLTALNLWHGLFRLTWISAAGTVGFMPLGLIGLLPGRGVAMLVALITVAYFAGADLLFVARYAGYVEIAEQQRLAAPAVAEPVPAGQAAS